jgi:hypothetical protein
MTARSWRARQLVRPRVSCRKTRLSSPSSLLHDCRPRTAPIVGDGCLFYTWIPPPPPGFTCALIRYTMHACVHPCTNRGVIDHHREAKSEAKAKSRALFCLPVDLHVLRLQDGRAHLSGGMVIVAATRRPPSSFPTGYRWTLGLAIKRAQSGVGVMFASITDLWWGTYAMAYGRVLYVVWPRIAICVCHRRMGRRTNKCGEWRVSMGLLFIKCI